ncbi:MAG: DUF192 domain-containing protein [Bacteroidia bacterium]|nr:DUF192 domain-containing protein [Bacteroidia bacterium]
MNDTRIKPSIILKYTLFLGLMAFFSCENPPPKSLHETHPVQSMQATPFRIGGHLRFLDGESGELRQQINVEIAETEGDRNVGLMYRKSMPDTVGMLFIMPEEEPVDFWMKDTYIPLDLIFLDKNQKILSIAPDNIPQSTSLISCTAPCKYVVEVNAGKSAAWGLETGDKMKLNRVHL